MPHLQTIADARSLLYEVNVQRPMAKAKLTDAQRQGDDRAVQNCMNVLARLDAEQAKAIAIIDTVTAALYNAEAVTQAEESNSAAQEQSTTDSN